MDNFLLSLDVKNKSSINTIQQAILRIEKILDKDFEDLKLKDFEDVESLINTLTENYSLNSVITTIINLKKFLKYKKAKDSLINEYNDYINDLVKERDEDKQKQNFKNEKEEENYIDYLTLKKTLLDKSKIYFENKKSFTEYRNFLILCLYVLMPPTRIQNWILMKKKDASNMKRRGESLTKKFNYLIKQTPGNYDVLFNNYKTASTLGSQRYSIENKTLNRLIENYLKNYAIAKSDFLFTNANARNMTQVNFTNALSSISKKILGKQLSNNLLRRIFLTYFLNLNPSFIEKQKILNVVGQKSVMSTADKYVIKEMNKGSYVLNFE